MENKKGSQEINASSIKMDISKNETLQQKIKNRIRDEIIKRKDTQAALAKRIDISPSDFSKILNETGRNISIGTLVSIARVYNLSLDDLCGLESQTNKTTVRKMGEWISNICVRLNATIKRIDNTKKIIAYEEDESPSYGEPNAGVYYSHAIIIPLNNEPVYVLDLEGNIAVDEYGRPEWSGFYESDSYTINKFLERYASLEEARKKVPGFSERGQLFKQGLHGLLEQLPDYC